MTGSAECGAVVPHGANPGLRFAPSGLRQLAQETRAEAHARRGHERVAAILLFTMSNSAVFSVPAARCCARVLLSSVPSTPMRGERSAERRVFPLSRLFGARRAVPNEARRASSGTRSPLGAPPWRFWAGGRASFSGISSGSVQRAPRSQVVVPGGRCPEPPGAKRLRAAAAGRHSPLRLRHVSGDDPSDERGFSDHITNTISSQHRICIVGMHTDRGQFE
jgi:hypothetical protein